MSNSLKNYTQSLNDPIAEKVAWRLQEITHRQYLHMPNKKSQLITDKQDSEKIFIKPNFKYIILNEGLYSAILIYFFIDVLSKFSYYPIKDSIFTIFVILILSYSIIYLLIRAAKISFNPAYFDVYNKIFIRGDKQINFSEIHAIQVVSGTNKGRQIIGMVQIKTQINLVLHDASRITICIENNIMSGQKIASEIARLTGTKLWDATDYIQKI